MVLFYYYHIIVYAVPVPVFTIEYNINAVVWLVRSVYMLPKHWKRCHCHPSEQSQCKTSYVLVVVHTICLIVQSWLYLNFFPYCTFVYLQKRKTVMLLLYCNKKNMTQFKIKKKNTDLNSRLKLLTLVTNSLAVIIFLRRHFPSYAQNVERLLSSCVILGYHIGFAVKPHSRSIYEP